MSTSELFKQSLTLLVAFTDHEAHKRRRNSRVVMSTDSYRLSSVVCRSVCRSVTIQWAAHKRLKRWSCSMGSGLRWAQRTMYYMGPDRPWEGTIVVDRGAHCKV